MADNDELEYYDDDDIRDQIPDDDESGENGEAAQPQRPPVRPLQTSSRQPAARPPAYPPRPVPRRQGRPVPKPEAQPPAGSAPTQPRRPERQPANQPARTPPRPPQRPPASSSRPPAQRQSPPSQRPTRPERQARSPRRRSAGPGGSAQAPQRPARAADKPGRLSRLSRLLRRKPRKQGRSAQPRRNPLQGLQALRARLPGGPAGGSRPVSGPASRTLPALRLPFLRRRADAAASASGAARKRRRGASKAPRLGGRGLTLDNKLDILGVLLLLGSLALFLSSLSSMRGEVTQLINTLLGNLFGWGAIAVPLALFAIGIWLIVRHFGADAPVIDPLRLAGIGLAYVGLLLFFQFADSFNPNYSSIDLSDPVRLQLQLELSWNAGRGGGSAGAGLYYLLVTSLGEVGMLVTMVGLMLIGAMLALQISAADLAAVSGSLWRRVGVARARHARERVTRRRPGAASAERRAAGLPGDATDDDPRPIPITMGGRTVTAWVGDEEQAEQADQPRRKGLRNLSPTLRAGVEAALARRSAATGAAASATAPPPETGAPAATPAPAPAMPALATPQPVPLAGDPDRATAPDTATAAERAQTVADADATPHTVPALPAQHPAAAELIAATAASPQPETEEAPATDIPPSPTSMRPTLAAAPRRKRRDWQLPDIRDLLNVGSESDLDREILLGRARTIEETLQSFGAPGRVVEVNTGPVITQFGVEPDYLLTRSGKKTRVKVGAIAQLDKDLQLALGAKTIRIEAPVPGKGYVGIEVPNAKAAVVSLRDVMESELFRALKVDAPLAIGLGQSVDGTPVAGDLASMPHLLIAGTTGSGKSVLVNAIIVSLLINNRPDQLRFIMVDPKRVELTSYNGVPHLVAPVVVDLERTLGVLKWVTREMDERYRKFSEAGARNIEDYNRHLTDDLELMPYIVVVIDELADLMMLAPDETERVITRIAALARATGIHLVIATQRPSVDVVTGLIKANFPARIAFAVAGGVDSRVILDQPGAERLLGKGDMLYLSGTAPAAARLQGVLVSPEEVDNVTRYWKRQALDEPAPKPLPDSAPERAEEDTSQPPALPDMPPLRAQETEQQVPTPQQAHLAFPDFSAWEAEKNIELHERVTDERDELYEQAVEMVRRLNKASVSLLQRRMRIGYTRAARLIDMMEDEGVVGPAQDGSKPREVLPE